ncbi:Dolichyl-phosphate-mannose-protein mannosyltransferase-domain-containing protein [Globomyces pollinis-pini]|nr:Dolichyl-phosphate-mannose-protein mannosyltransferase-domain-containing protein [Globomyces pollinis-pini]
MPTGSHSVCLLLTFIALFSRLYNLGASDRIVWDESHFGRFASHYLKREFYFDVHPPLGKMINGLAGLLCGYYGQFEFKGKYPENLNYVFMRGINAIFGSMLTPLAYWTAIHLRVSRTAAVLLAIMTITDVALCTISRLILLDSMLMFFTGLGVYCLCVFRTYQQIEPLSLNWILWLFLSGLSLGLVTSVKWVGLFLVALVGIHTISDLWEMFGDQDIKLKHQILHWIARIGCLIVLPLAIYILSFKLHFGILINWGKGAGRMNTLFKSELIGSKLAQFPVDVAYGSTVSIRESSLNGLNLHSHTAKYPKGSKMQQITGFHKECTNNYFTIEYPWNSNKRTNSSMPSFIKNGSEIRLAHVNTKKDLHCQKVAAPITKGGFEVNAKRTKGGSKLDRWIVQIVDDTIKPTTTLRAVSTNFRLINKSLNCTLVSTRKTLPDWAQKQSEIVCQKNVDPNYYESIWHIEYHTNPNLTSKKKNPNLQSSFLHNFIELNKAMWISNNNLTPNPYFEMKQIESKPYQWPFLLKPIRITAWKEEYNKVYLIGNPLIWWGSSIGIIVLSVTVLVYTIRRARRIEDFTENDWDTFNFAAKVSVLGWILHYFPFYFMGRIMYLHHYFPALYFSMIAFVVVFDHFAAKLSELNHQRCLVSAMVLFTLTFLVFSPFSYGIQGDPSRYSQLQWLSTWKFFDNKSK